MFLARVEKRVISSIKHKSYNGKAIFIVRPVYPDGTAKGNEQIAIDYIGAGVGDIVVCGGAPGVARTVFNLELAPIKTLIMAIVDKVDYHDI